MILKKLGICGWKEEDENLLFASILTGDPLLLIGTHGSAKTYIANLISKILNKKFVAYDASKSMFEDILGFPNIEKLKEGLIEYIQSKTTIWDKEFILVDEINRAIPELQSKWLEIIRSRKIMGFPTEVKWVWAAMNPISYSATEEMDEALIGRFAYFIYSPEAMEMSEDDRSKVISHINGDDCPAISHWLNISEKTKHIVEENEEKLNNIINKLIKEAAVNFIKLKSNMKSLPEFLSKLSFMIYKESDKKVKLDGRRLGFIYRNILANRAIEIAKSELLERPLPSFAESARNVIVSSIPVGLNDETVNKESLVNIIYSSFDMLKVYFENNSDINITNVIYELFTTDDMIRKLELIVENNNNISNLIKSKLWSDLQRKEDCTEIGLILSHIYDKHPDLISNNLLEPIIAKINIVTTINVDQTKVNNYIDIMNIANEAVNDVEKCYIMKQINKALTNTEYVNVTELKNKVMFNLEKIRKIMA